MNFQQLKYFTVLCKKGSFSKAAESLYISQQGLSMAISNLESEFSCRFFNRSSKGLTLTKDGEFFRDWSENMLKEFERCWAHFEGRDADISDIKVAGTQGVLSEFATDLTEEFEDKYSGYKIFIREFPSKRVDEEVDSGKVELGFGLEPMDTQKFECHRIFSCNLVLLLHESSPLAQYEKIPLELLSGQSLITVDENFKSVDNFLSELGKRGISITPKYRVGEITAIHRLVRENHGVGLSVDLVARALATPDTVYRHFDGEGFDWTIDIFKKKSVALTKSSRIFFEYVQRKMAFDDRCKIAPAKLMEINIT